MNSNTPPSIPPASGSRPKIHRADKSLQAKVGLINVTEEQIANAERAIEDVREEFGPLAIQLLEKLAQAAEAARSNPAAASSKESLIQPVMQLKANAKMFGYDLVTSLANIMLGFLESVDVMDATSVEIVAAHHKTLKLIIDRKMTGNGGPIGSKLEAELRSACMRYLAKKQGD